MSKHQLPAQYQCAHDRSINIQLTKTEKKLVWFLIFLFGCIKIWSIPARTRDNNDKNNSCSIIIEHLPSVVHYAKHLRSDNPFNHSQNMIRWKLKGWPCKLVKQGSEVLNDLSQLMGFKFGIPTKFLCCLWQSHHASFPSEKAFHN